MTRVRRYPAARTAVLAEDDGLALRYLFQGSMADGCSRQGGRWHGPAGDLLEEQWEQFLEATDLDGPD
ncbi:MAG: hypothetical protein CMD84_03905 [Gammaproteobacteria bacterium]|nr:hypothetical protein [Gammaproteobacteria bacterium]